MVRDRHFKPRRIGGRTSLLIVVTGTTGKVDAPDDKILLTTNRSDACRGGFHRRRRQFLHLPRRSVREPTSESHRPLRNARGALNRDSSHVGYPRLSGARVTRETATLRRICGLSRLGWNVQKKKFRRGEISTYSNSETQVLGLTGCGEGFLERARSVNERRKSCEGERSLERGNRQPAGEAFPASGPASIPGPTTVSQF